MATKAWFDYATYMGNKLAQMQETYPNERWTASSLKKAFEDAGFVGDEGAQRHFQKYGHTEDVSPNKYFDAEYYYKAKAIQYYGLTENGGLTKAQVEADMDTYAKNMEGAIKAAGMDAWTHYIKWGTAEGINPSNEFDTSDYMAAKLAALQAAEPSAGWTMASMNAAFKSAGLNALEHYMQYANKGAGEVTSTDISDYAVPESEQIDDTKTDGTTKDFTTGTDTIAGTNGNDQFNGITSNSGSTYQVGDSLNDPSTTDADVLTLRVSGTNATTPYVPVKNVENITVLDTSATGNNSTFDASGVTGAKQIQANVATAGTTTTLSGITSLDTEAALTGKGDMTATWTASLLEGDNNTVKVGIENAGAKGTNALLENASTVTVGNDNTVEGVVLSTSGTNYVLLDAGTKAASYSIKGDGVNVLQLTDGGSGDISVDASGMTSGSVDISFDGAKNRAVTVTGSLGDDKFRFGNQLDKNDSVDGGSGDDTVFTTISASKLAPKLANVENLNATVTGGSFDGSNADGLVTVTVDEQAATKFDKMAATVKTLNINTSNTNTTDFAFASADKTELTVNVGQETGNDEKGASVTADKLTLKNAATVVVNSYADANNTAAVTNVFAGIEATGTTSLTLNTAAKANLTTGALTGKALTDLTLNVVKDTALTTVAQNLDALADGAKLQNLTYSVEDGGTLVTGKIGTANGTATAATALKSIKIEAGDKATLDLGSIFAANANYTSALADINVKLGDFVTFTNSLDIDAGSGDKGADATLTVEVGEFNTGLDLGAIDAAALSADLKIGDQAGTTAKAVGIALNAASMGTISAELGANVDATITLGNTVTSTSATNGGVGNIALTGDGSATIAKGTNAMWSYSQVDASELKGDLTLDMSGLAANGGSDSATILMAQGYDTITGNANVKETFTWNEITVKADTNHASGDTIATFTGGAGADVLDFTALDVSQGAFNGLADATSGDVSGHVFLTTQTTAATIAALFGTDASTNLVIDENGKAIALSGTNNGNSALNVYIVDAGSDGLVSADEVTLIGSVTVATAALVDGNIA